ncbi:4-hydroxy-2-oxoglutarate aldolase, mitochondrial [Sporothrix eucalyptigena]|uniref:4-hydroxy-2-oxoglutarate aldolase, mitochondrial n=1 Tax=Sporothrix eucalyptigena TaxID=1812306 RepID=A0ABP0CSL6_9PEZI
MTRTLVAGIYAPTQTFFLPAANTASNQTPGALDAATIAKHAIRLAKAGCTGLVCNGSNGEAALLTAEERAQVVKITREALDATGLDKVPIIAGTSANSVADTLALTRDAAAAGADAVLVLSPTFVGGGIGMGPAGAGIERFYQLVADESPLPLVLYNYPAAAAGFDLDSDALLRLASHPNIIGTKFTCGSVGKMARVIGQVAPVISELDNTTSGYLAFSGVADFILPAVIVGGSGAIVGAANVFPRACVEVYNLSVAGKLAEARTKQQALAKADWSLTKRAIPGFKAILDHYHGYGGLPRLPILPISAEAAAELYEEIGEYMKYEQSLPDVA